jgi:PAS domain S-box-containing protein
MPLDRLGRPGVPSNVVARDVLDNLLEGCQVVSSDWTYLYLNDAAVRQAQRPREELLGRTMMACFPGIERTEMFRTLERCMRERSHARLENEFRFPNGSTGWFELRFVPVPAGVCILSLDITEAKRAAAALSRSETQMRHMQKMDAIGRLAGGVAHDFNNLLTVILGCGEFLRQKFTPDEPAAREAAEILHAAERASSLTRQLLAFSRQQVLEPRVLDLNASITSLDRMLRRLIGEHIDLVTHASEGLGRVKADPGQLEQVLVNLVLNARDAMPEGGKLTVETADIDLDEAYARERVDLQPGRYVMVAVSDTGCGMGPEVLSKIFEPFFTTKPVGVGTGLGLSTAHGIVKQSGGHIEVYSELGQGTTFKVYLPRVEAPSDAEPHATCSAGASRGRETVLLVEDEEAIRRVLSATLRERGYTVLEVSDGSQAIAICERRGQPIDLLITDVVMPLMSGPELVRRVRATHPTLPTLFVSGYTERALLHQGLREAHAVFLQKPFTPDLLARRVRDILDGTMDQAA